MSQPLFEEGVYCVVDNDKAELAGIKILTGEYEGTIYSYGQVGFEDGKPHINFERNFHIVPEGKTLDELNTSEELNQLIGDILVELISHQIAKEENNEQRSIEGTD